MKKFLLLLCVCLSSLSTYAQDDDVYFVPSSKDRMKEKDTYTSTSVRSSYTPITGSEQVYETSNWADGRGNGGRDIDAYNRRGRNYRGSAADSIGYKKMYDEAYDDGYEDGLYTARIVRFCSPRVGVYVSSPFYFDYYDLCGLYDPFYYGYGNPWSLSFGWSGWYGWGSWYGWRPYYSIHWGWGSPWYDPWYDPWYGPVWGGPHWTWHPTHWLPSNAERGPVGGWVSRGGSRGSYGTAGNIHVGGGRGSSSKTAGRGFGVGRTGTYSPRRTFGTVNNNPERNTTPSNKNSGRSFGTTTPNTSNSTRSNSRSFDTNRGYSTPSRGGGSGFGSRGAGRGSVGGSRSFGGRR